MKNWINKVSKEKMQRFLFIGVLILVFGVFFISLSFIEPNPGDTPNDPPTNDPNDDDPPVTYETIKVPVAGESFQVIRKYWTLSSTTEDQVVSLIKFGSKYFTSKGVSYTVNNEDFNVVASLSGVVKSVTDSPVYGKTVVIEHDNDIVTEYLSLGNVTVEVGDEVDQGEVIGTSGTNEYDQAAENHVHFKISVDGKYRNPEELIGKKVNQLE